MFSHDNEFIYLFVHWFIFSFVQYRQTNDLRWKVAFILKSVLTIMTLFSKFALFRIISSCYKCMIFYCRCTAYWQIHWPFFSMWLRSILFTHKSKQTIWSGNNVHFIKLKHLNGIHVCSITFDLWWGRHLRQLLDSLPSKPALVMCIRMNGAHTRLPYHV